MQMPLYRIMPLEQFLQIVLEGKNTLVRPHLWEDPYEKIPKEKLLIIKEMDWDVNLGSQPWESWYGQCWSSSSENDGLWRAFTHNKEVRCVKVKTTSNKLYNSLLANKDDDWECYLTRVNYLDKEPYQEVFSKILDINKVKYLELEILKNEMVKGMLSNKRQAFSYENEVRLLINDKSLGRHEDTLKYSFDVNKVIENVEFDPWTPPYMKSTYESLFKELKFEGDCSFSNLYNSGESNEINVKLNY